MRPADLSLMLRRMIFDASTSGVCLPGFVVPCHDAMPPAISHRYSCRSSWRPAQTYLAECHDGVLPTHGLLRLQMPSRNIMTAAEHPMQDAPDLEMLMQPVHDPSPMEDGAWTPPRRSTLHSLPPPPSCSDRNSPTCLSNLLSPELH